MKNEYTITKRLMRSWAKGGWFNSADNMFRLLLVCFGTVVIIFLPYLFIHLFSFSSGDEIPDILYTFCFYSYHIGALLVLVLIPFAPRIWYVRKYNTFCKNYSVKEWQRVTEFTEDEIIVTDHKSIFKYQYRTIRRVKERGNVVHIFLKSGTEIIIHKDAFVKGSWEKCKSLISRKSLVKIK
jgi:hypothetical protein